MKNYLQTLRKSFILPGLGMTLALSSIACSRQEFQRRPHDSAISSDKVEVQEVLSTETLRVEERQKIEKALEQNSDSSRSSLIQDLIEKLKESFTNRDAKKVYSQKNLEIINYLNEAIRIEIASGKDLSLAQKHIQAYINLVTAGCSSEIENCQNLSFFANDEKTSNNLEAIAQAKNLNAFEVLGQKEEVEKYFSLMLLSFESRNRSLSNNFALHFSKRFKEYEPFLQKHSESFQSKVKSAIQYLTLFIRNSNSEDLKAYLKLYGNWDTESGSISKDQNIISQLIVLNSSQNLYAKDGRLSEDFKAALKSIQDKNDNLGPSFRIKLAKFMASTADAKLKAKLTKAQNDDFYDEYFYIIDRVFRNHLPISTATEILAHTKKDLAVLNTRLETYVQTEFIILLSDTNQGLVEIMKDKGMYGSDSLQLLIDKSQPYSLKWKSLYSQIQRLQLFTRSILQNKDSEDLRKTERSLLSFGKSIKVAVTGPLTLAMTYYISQKKQSLTFKDGYNQDSKIEPDTLIYNLFNPESVKERLTSWFDFGNESALLSSSELLSSYSYMLDNRMFETLGGSDFDPSKIQSDGVTRARFLRQFINSYFAFEITRIQSSTQALSGTYSLPTASDICSKLKVGQLNFVQNLELGDLKMGVSFGGNGSALYKELSEGLDYAYKGEDSSREGEHTVPLLQLMTKHIAPSLDLFTSLIEATKKDAQNEKMTPEERQRFESVLDGTLSELRSSYSGYVQNVKSKLSTVKACARAISTVENRNQTKLIQLEKEHLGRVYDAILVLRSAKDASTEANLSKKFSTDFGFTDGFDRIEKNGYRYSQLDFYKRQAAQYNRNKLLPRIEVSFANLERYDFYTNRSFIFLEVNDSEQTLKSKARFIADGLARLNQESNRDSMIAWPMTTQTSEISKSELLINIELYKIGRVLVQTGTSIDDVVESWMNYAKSQTHTQEEMELISALGLNSKFASASLNSNYDRAFFFRDNSTESISLGDDLYTRTLETMDRQDTALSFYQSYQAAGLYVLPPQFIPHQVLTEQYQVFFQRMELIQQELQAALSNRLAKNPKELFSNFRGEEAIHLGFAQVETGKTLVYNFPDSEGQKASYLSQKAIETRKEKDRLFNEKTNSYFQKKMRKVE